MPKFEIIIEYEGDLIGLFDFMRELQTEFDCKIVANEVSEEGEVLTGLIALSDKADTST